MKTDAAVWAVIARANPVRTVAGPPAEFLYQSTSRDGAVLVADVWAHASRLAAEVVGCAGVFYACFKPREQK